MSFTGLDRGCAAMNGMNEWRPTAWGGAVAATGHDVDGMSGDPWAPLLATQPPALPRSPGMAGLAAQLVAPR